MLHHLQMHSIPVSISVLRKQFTTSCSLSQTNVILHGKKKKKKLLWLSYGQILFSKKKKILRVDTLMVIIRNFVLCWKSILVLNCHSFKYRPEDTSWNINHRYTFSLTLAIKQDIWYAFSEFSTLSIKIHLQFWWRETNVICRHTQHTKS